MNPVHSHIPHEHDQDDHGACGSAHCCGGSHAHEHEHAHAARVPTQLDVQGADILLLNIPAMDCPAEEGQIRRVLEAVTGIRRLQFDLAGRALAVHANPAHWDAVRQAIAAAGFDNEVLSSPPAAEDVAASRQAEWIRLALALAVALLASDRA